MKSPRKHPALPIATFLTAALGTAGSAAADDTVAELTRPSSSVTFGAGYLSGERDQFSVYDGLRGDEGALLFDADIRQRDDETGTWTTGKLRNLGIDNRNAELRYEKQGHWGVGLDIRQIPRFAPYDINTGMSGLGSEMQAVPSAADGYVPGAGSTVVLDTRRTGVGVDFNYYLAPNLNFTIDFKQEDKEGDRHWGRGGQAEFAAEPIDSTTRQLDVKLDYVGKQFQMTGGYYGSTYDNDNDMVTTYRGLAAPGSEYNLSLPLSNLAHQFYVNGGYNFTPTTRGTFRASFTHATVDEHLPTSDVPGLSWDGVGPRPFAAAPTQLDAAIDTTNIALGLTARPMSKLSLVANVRYHKVDDRTPADLVVCRRCDDADPTNDQFAHSTPLDYETLSGKLEGTYRLPMGYSVTAGVDYKDQDRTVPFGIDDDGDGFDDERYVPFRSNVEELTYRLQLRKSLSETVNGSIAFTHSVRDGSSFAPAIHSNGLTAGSLIHPINIADRDRNKVRLSVDWAPSQNLGLQFNVEEARDDYDGPGATDYGLLEGKARVLSMDADYRLNDSWHLTSWVSWDRTEATQRNYHDTNIGGLADTDRTADLTDTGTSLGFGVDGKINERLKIGADAEWTRTRSEFKDDIPAAYYLANVSPLDEIKNTATKLGFFAEYMLAKHSQLRFDLVHEIWRTNDWSWQFSDGSAFTYGTTNDGTMVIQDPRQSSTFVGLRYRYNFM